VEKRADKTCNTISVMESRRIYDSVHLEGLRCTGNDHGGCQAQCLLYWKEAWLKRVQDGQADVRGSAKTIQLASASSLYGWERLAALTRRQDSSTDSEIAYRCQATDLLKASEPLPWWDVRQYFRDIWSGNVGLVDLVKAALFNIFRKTLQLGAYRAQIRVFNRFQSWRGGTPYPYLWGTLDKTPSETLGLQPGDLVQVKSFEEILKTLNKKNRNKGLYFAPEMVPFCTSVRRVRARVERIIDERTGKMLTLPGECLILEGAMCTGEFSERRLFCPRGIYPYWREIWLKRAREDQQQV
jgi:hypothetical protein